jgi:S1-C subfamily serine protease
MNPCRLKLWLPALAVALVVVLTAPAQVPAPVVKAEAERVAAVAKVRPAVVAVFARGGKGGGSGVLISKDGYALTNFHVVQGSGPTMQCGLADGVLYDAVLVGTDKVGDVALIQLLPDPKKKDKKDQEFPFAPLGDSDKLREGDWSLAMGNPFLLATDFTPTVTFGLISGVHRYQYPAGTLLEYTDCIQIDTSINPGNSGGPLFNLKGELIGINGRGSFDKRGRVNSGVGYAISINQIKNFMGHLKAGLDADHASLGATVATPEGAPLGTLQVNQFLEDSDVGRRGIQIDDDLVSVDGRPLSSVNNFKNIMGLYPRGWRIPVEYRRNSTRKEMLVRLMGIQARVFDEDQPKQPMPLPGQPGPKPKLPGPPPPQGPAAALYKPKPFFANYHFNEAERLRVLTAFQNLGDFKKLAGPWTITGTIRLKQLKAESKASIEIGEEKQGGSEETVVRMKVDAFPYILEPLKKQDAAALREPLGSGGFLGALYVYRRLLTQGAGGFIEITHGGREPLYPPPAEAKMPRSLRDLRVDAEVLNSRFGPFLVKWFFSTADQKLLGFELRQEENEDPCEVYLSDYRQVDGRWLPHRMQVIYGDSHYGTVTIRGYQLAAK